MKSLKSRTLLWDCEQFSNTLMASTEHGPAWLAGWGKVGTCSTTTTEFCTHQQRLAEYAAPHSLRRPLRHWRVLVCVLNLYGVDCTTSWDLRHCFNMLWTVLSDSMISLVCGETKIVRRCKQIARHQRNDEKMVILQVFLHNVLLLSWHDSSLSNADESFV